jgi:acyl-CoA thioesterase
VPHSLAHEDAHARIELRQVEGRCGVFSRAPVSADGRVRVWMRPAHGSLDAATLAMAADVLPTTVSDALDERAGGSSLDNVFRYYGAPAGPGATDPWVLAELSISVLRDGLGHGIVDLWARDGTPLATGSQSFVIRRYLKA